MLRRILVATALLFTAPAQAATYLVTYTGTASYFDGPSFPPPDPGDPNQEQRLSYFGGPTDTLTTAPFIAVFTFQFPLPDQLVYSDGYMSELSADYMHPSSSGLTADLTINGITMRIPTWRVNYIRQFDALGSGQYSNKNGIETQGTALFGEHISAKVTSDTHEIVTSTDFTQPLDYTVQPGDDSTGDFNFQYYYQSNGPSSASGTLAIDRVTVALADSAAAVPEPAAWATMLIGFGLVGGAMRRSRAAKVKPRFDFA